MKTENRNSTEEAKIRALVEDWAGALRARDIDGMMSHYAPDVCVYDIVPPLQVEGAEAYRGKWEEWFATVKDPIAYDVRGLDVVAGDDVAFSQSLNHVRTTMQDGEECDTWIRVTVGYRKIDGEWLVVHEHISVPVEMETGEAALDLVP